MQCASSTTIRPASAVRDGRTWSRKSGLFNRSGDTSSTSTSPARTRARIPSHSVTFAELIVSPLLSLMRHQVDAARRAEIRAETINSANVTEWDGIRARVRAGEVDVLLVSPERLNNPDFRDQVLPSLTAEAGLIVVDEAHCISDWGHDFRPDYRRIATMLTALPAGTPVLATTATANARVTADVAEQLETGSHVGNVLVLRGTLVRSSVP